MTYQQRQFHAMGTDINVAISSNPETALPKIDDWFGQVELIVRHYEQRWSRFISDNELADLNNSNGSWHEISSDLAVVLHLAESAWLHSGGLFSPYLGYTIANLGYETSFDTMEKDQRMTAVPISPSNNTLNVNLTDASDARKRLTSPIEWSSEDPHRVRLRPFWSVDLGGIAKGWIVEQGALALQRSGIQNFVIDAGGDMICSGQNEDEPWHVSILNPLTGDNALVVDVTSTSVATSGTYKRQWRRNGESLHHILDPRTGSSAQTDIISCSVFHPNLTEAEWIAKTALIQGSEDGIPWLQKQTHRGWVIITQSGEVKHPWT